MLNSSSCTQPLHCWTAAAACAQACCAAHNFSISSWLLHTHTLTLCWLCPRSQHQAHLLFTLSTQPCLLLLHLLPLLPSPLRRILRADAFRGGYQRPDAAQHRSGQRPSTHQPQSAWRPSRHGCRTVHAHHRSTKPPLFLCRRCRARRHRALCTNPPAALQAARDTADRGCSQHGLGCAEAVWRMGCGCCCARSIPTPSTASRAAATQRQLPHLQQQHAGRKPSCRNVSVIHASAATACISTHSSTCRCPSTACTGQLVTAAKC